MSGRAVFFYLSLILTVTGSNADGEFSVLHSPHSLQFTGTSKILESHLKEVYSASLGLSVVENANWNGVSIVDPFNTPEAVVEIYIDGIPNLGNSIKAKNFPMKSDEYDPDMYPEMKHRIIQRYTNGRNKLVDINLSNPNELELYRNIFGNIAAPKISKQTLQHLKYSVEEDYQFLTELEILKAITDKVNSGVISADNIIDFYNFRFHSLHALSDVHGPSSLQTKEAKKLLGSALERLSAAFARAYSGRVLVAAVSSDVAHTRRVRAVRDTHARQAEDDSPSPSLPETSPAPSEIPENTAAPDDDSSSDAARSISPNTPYEESSTESSFPKAKPPTATPPTDSDPYSSDYPAIFNIILWFGVVFAFSLIAIVYAIMDMDPGRDSIIYRMTSTRMKKDN